MTGSPLAHALIFVAPALGVVIWLVLLLLAGRRPYFRHPHPEQMPGKIKGGMHLGDPRSQGPPEGELAVLPDGASQADGTARAGGTSQAESGPDKPLPRNGLGGDRSGAATTGAAPGSR